MSKTRVADIIANFIWSDLGVPYVFTITGGGAMFLNDGVAKHPHLQAVCNHHEQASAMAAVGYSKTNNKISVVMPTTGCGVTNTITGLLDAWQDNVASMYISGQVKSHQTSYCSDLALRQLGVQEANVIPVVQSLTKYAVVLTKAEEVLYHLQKAAFLAKHGRPGPVWIDVPMDIQGAVIETESLIGFSPEEEYPEQIVLDDSDLSTMQTLLRGSKRPVVFAGNGVKLAGAESLFRDFVEKFNIPVVTTYLGIDILSSDHPLMIGRSGIKGDRAGNFTLANSDLVIAIGNRLSIPATGFEFDAFARDAKLLVIDIDALEHQKDTVKIDCFIHADLRDCLKVAMDFDMQGDSYLAWLEKTQSWKEKWPVCLPAYAEEKSGINLYYFMEQLSKHLPDDSCVVSDAGSSYYVSSQALKLKQGQQYITSGAQADMGFTLPAAIGVSFAKPGVCVVGITGDGSLQMNIQELQTIVHHNLPIKIVVWNNNGYLSIRATQKKFFESRFIGTDDKSGVSFPDLEKIANAYGLQFKRVSNSIELVDNISDFLNLDGPAILEVISPENQEIVPNVSALKKDDGTLVSKPIEDMYPFLDREEFLGEMIIEPLG